MDKKLMLIVNPVAGRSAYKPNFAEATLLLAQAGYRVDLYYTAARGDATVFARDHAAGYDAVACIGGDGTLSEVISGLIQLDNPPPLGYFPMGTANDVATTLGLPRTTRWRLPRACSRARPTPMTWGSSAGTSILPISQASAPSRT